jgi:hypothetical protein
MKFVRSVSALAIALITIFVEVAATTALEAYTTKKDQVVVTGLKAKEKYNIQYRNAKGKDGQRQVKTNACGEALIGKAAKFQSVTINGQNLEPKILTLKEHRKCSIRQTAQRRRTKTVTTIQPTAFPSNPSSISPQ